LLTFSLISEVSESMLRLAEQAAGKAIASAESSAVGGSSTLVARPLERDREGLPLEWIQQSPLIGGDIEVREALANESLR
jgi:hypothetical protein